MTRVEALDFLDELRAFGAIFAFKNRKLVIVQGLKSIGPKRYERFRRHRAVLATVRRIEIDTIRAALSPRSLAP